MVTSPAERALNGTHSTELTARAVDFITATVHADYLEKQRVEYWSQRYLADLLALQQRTLRHSVLQLRD